MITDYKNVIKNFTALSRVPRGSGHNEKISAFLCDFAKNLGLSYTCDRELNVIIKKPAQNGGSGKPVVLQGHMDMVCVEEPGTGHDFENTGLDLVFEDEWVSAKGTTLGGDDGIALAYMMSLLEDKEIKHPDLICIVTTDEETGMYGAKALETSVFEDAEYLINMDSENENECLCGCAGGLRIDGRIPAERMFATGTGLDITLSGLRGGHSGAEIHKGITNAVRLLARILEEIKEYAVYQVVSFSGGEKDNAIPSFASCKLILGEGSDIAGIKEYIAGIGEKYRRREKDIKISLDITEHASASACTGNSFENILFALLALPDGVQAMSPDIEGLVETSLNLGVFALNEAEAKFNISLRSSVLGEKEFLSDKVIRILKKAGGTGTKNSEYPAWEYRPVSKLREAYSKAFEKTHGEPVKFNVIHAGLECGLFAKMKPELDMISIGPEMHDIHSPKERLNLSSSISLYKTVEELLSTIE